MSQALALQMDALSVFVQLGCNYRRFALLTAFSDTTPVLAEALRLYKTFSPLCNDSKLGSVANYIHDFFS